MTFPVILTMLAFDTAFYISDEDTKQECGLFHFCPKDLAAIYVPALIYSFILICFICAETLLKLHHPKQDVSYTQIES